MRQTVIGVIALLALFALETFQMIHVYAPSFFALFLFLFGLISHVFFFKRGAQKEEAFVLLPAGTAVAVSIFTPFSENWAFYAFSLALGLIEWALFSEEELLKKPAFIMFGASLLALIDAGYAMLAAFAFLLAALIVYWQTKKSERSLL